MVLGEVAGLKNGEGYEAGVVVRWGRDNCPQTSALHFPNET